MKENFYHVYFYINNNCAFLRCGICWIFNWLKYFKWTFLPLIAIAFGAGVVSYAILSLKIKN